MRLRSHSLIVITGASSGIGAATAKAFSALGHPLLLIARRTGRLTALGLPKTIAATVDVTNLNGLKEAILSAEKEFGPTDCLVNNAGVMLLGKVQSQSPDEWQKMLDVNVMGVLNGIHAVLSGMIARGRGTV